MTKIEGMCPGASCLMTLTAMWLHFRSLVFCKTDMLAWDYFSSVAAMVFWGKVCVQMLTFPGVLEIEPRSITFSLWMEQPVLVAFLTAVSNTWPEQLKRKRLFSLMAHGIESHHSRLASCGHSGRSESESGALELTALSLFNQDGSSK